MNLVLARRSHISTPTRTNLPQSLTQAQRDYFGAHTYQRADDPSGAFVYTDWQAKTAEALKASKPAVLVSNRSRGGDSGRRRMLIVLTKCSPIPFERYSRLATVTSDAAIGALVGCRLRQGF